MTRLLDSKDCLGAVRVVWKFWKDPSRGIEMKRMFSANVSQLEAYTESAPTLIITVYLLLSPDNSEISRDTKKILISDMTTFIIFTTSSFLMASFGLSRCLKDGVARIMGPGGHLQVCIGLFLGEPLPTLIPRAIWQASSWWSTFLVGQHWCSKEWRPPSL